MAFQYDERLLQTKAELLKSLAHPARLCILRGLIDQGPSCPSEIQACLHLPQSTISQHLARLRRVGIVEATRQGLEVHYRLVDPEVKEILEILFSEKGVGDDE